jgi:hypothetical protein
MRRNAFWDWMGHVAYFCTFIVVSTVTILAVYGYRYDFEAQKFQKTGVLIIDSPIHTKVELEVDGEAKEVKLPYQDNSIRAGEHTVRVRKTGYTSWEKRIMVSGENVTEVKDIYLVPDNLSKYTTYFEGETDKCFFEENFGEALCSNTEKKIFYFYYPKAYRNYRYKIKELPMENFERVVWVAPHVVLFFPKEGREFLRYDVFKGTTKEGKIPEFVETFSLENFVRPYVYYRTGEKVFSYHPEREEHTFISDQVQMLGIKKGKPLMIKNGETYGIEQEGKKVEVKKITPFPIAFTDILNEEEEETMDYLRTQDSWVVASLTGYLPTYKGKILFTNALKELRTIDKNTQEETYITRFSDPVVNIKKSIGDEHVLVRTTAQILLCAVVRTEPCSKVLDIEKEADVAYAEKQNVLFVRQGKKFFMIDLYFGGDKQWWNTPVIAEGEEQQKERK